MPTMEFGESQDLGALRGRHRLDGWMDKTIRRAGSLLIVGAIIVGAAACDSPSTDEPSDIQRAETTLDRIGATGLTTLPPSDDTSFIDGVLADGDVTPLEMEQAYLSFLECLSLGGGSGRYAYDLAVGSGIVLEWGVVDDSPEGELTDLVGNRCRAQYLSTVEATYAASHPTDSSGKEVVIQRTLSCVVSAFPDLGGDLSADSTEEQLNKAIDEVAEDPNSTAQEQVQMYECSLFGSYGDWRAFGER